MFLVVIITFLDMIDHEVADKITCSSADKNVGVWLKVEQMSLCAVKIKNSIKSYRFLRSPTFLFSWGWFKKLDSKRNALRQQCLHGTIYSPLFARSPQLNILISMFKLNCPQAELLRARNFMYDKPNDLRGRKNIPRLSKILLSIHSLLSNNFYLTFLVISPPSPTHVMATRKKYPAHPLANADWMGLLKVMINIPPSVVHLKLMKISSYTVHLLDTSRCGYCGRKY